jgi:hypothetical protein
VSACRRPLSIAVLLIRSAQHAQHIGYETSRPSRERSSLANRSRTHRCPFHSWLSISLATSADLQIPVQVTYLPNKQTLWPMCSPSSCWPPSTAFLRLIQQHFQLPSASANLLLYYCFESDLMHIILEQYVFALNVFAALLPST